MKRSSGCVSAACAPRMQSKRVRSPGTKYTAASVRAQRSRRRVSLRQPSFGVTRVPSLLPSSANTWLPPLSSSHQVGPAPALQWRNALGRPLTSSASTESASSKSTLVVQDQHLSFVVPGLGGVRLASRQRPPLLTHTSEAFEDPRSTLADRCSWSSSATPDRPGRQPTPTLRSPSPRPHDPPPPRPPRSSPILIGHEGRGRRARKRRPRRARRSRRRSRRASGDGGADSRPAPALARAGIGADGERPAGWLGHGGPRRSAERRLSVPRLTSTPRCGRAPRGPTRAAGPTGVPAGPAAPAAPRTPPPPGRRSRTAPGGSGFAATGHEPQARYPGPG